MPGADVGSYGEEVLQIEPHGIDPISPAERHGRPRSLFTLWFSANLEFATLSAGALSVGIFGLSLWQAALSIIIGNVVGAACLGLLTTFGYKWGVPQLIQSRGAFGLIGNFVPSTFNFIAGVGWYAVNTVLGVYALQWLLPIGFLPNLILLIIIQALVSIYGHNLIHWVERVAASILAIVFIIVTIYAVGHIHWGVAENVKAVAFSGTFGSFILSVGVALSYMMGWMTYSSDYSRYLPQDTPGVKAFFFAFWGNVIPCVWLEVLGAGLATVANIAVPTDLISGLLPHALGVIAMFAIILGTVTANVLNIYSGSLSLLAIDVNWIRAVAPKRWVAALLIGVLGGVLSFLGGQSGYYQNYTNFLLVLGYWISPWLAVVLSDYFLVRSRRSDIRDFYAGAGTVRAGFWAFLIGLACSVPFFNQSLFMGFIAKQFPQIGDLSYYVSFSVAFLLYAWFSARHRRELSASSLTTA